MASFRGVLCLPPTGLFEAVHFGSMADMPVYRYEVGHGEVHMVDVVVNAHGPRVDREQIARQAVRGLQDRPTFLALSR